MLSKVFGRKYLQFQKEKYVGSFDLIGAKFKNGKWLKRKDLTRTNFCKSARIKTARTYNIHVHEFVFFSFSFFSMF